MPKTKNVESEIVDFLIGEMVIENEEENPKDSLRSHKGEDFLEDSEDDYIFQPDHKNEKVLSKNGLEDVKFDRNEIFMKTKYFQIS